ncbi:hypothetical protein CHU92_10190 [Flavobacterium cyanobacteriorum]|uniref:Uncharacterized protein n=1 Tax=Flavobacterium cyanobacteriorum TaxID=2022802 RepID=A0A255Z3Q1_9FLAO|nr:DUF1456 family protein [Flavobacterium cyanobacteriorum]OYQ36098.1 hypothetical protein CHU92_10190 [Flavobacterium cyanobacteriorum]
MNNNDIFKKLRVALQLRDDQIVDILQLVDFRISKSEIGAFFRNADHPKYMECGDQVLRNFLDGLVIHLRGTKDNPKNPNEVLEQNKAAVKDNTASKEKLIIKKPAKQTDLKSTTAGKAGDNTKKPVVKKPSKITGDSPKKPAPVMEKVKFNNGKNKKS